MTEQQFNRTHPLGRALANQSEMTNFLGGWLKFLEDNGQKLYLYNLIKNIETLSKSDEAGEDFPSHNAIEEQIDTEKLEAFEEDIEKKTANNLGLANNRAENIADTLNAGSQYWLPGEKEDKKDKKIVYKNYKDSSEHYSWPEAFKGHNYKIQVEHLTKITGMLHYTPAGKELLKDLVDPTVPPMSIGQVFIPPDEEKAATRKVDEDKSDDDEVWKITESLVNPPADDFESPFKGHVLGRIEKDTPTARNLVRLAYNVLPGIIDLYRSGDEAAQKRAVKVYGVLSARVLPNSFADFETMIRDGDASTVSSVAGMLGSIESVGSITLAVIYDGPDNVPPVGNGLTSSVKMLASSLGFMALILSPKESAFDQITSLTGCVGSVASSLGNLAEATKPTQLGYNVSDDLGKNVPTFQKFGSKGMAIRTAKALGPISEVIGTAYAVENGFLAADKGLEGKAWGHFLGAAGGIAGMVGLIGGITAATGVGVVLGVISLGVLYVSGSLSSIGKWIRHTYFGTAYGERASFVDTWDANYVPDRDYGYVTGIEQGQQTHNFLRQIGGYHELKYPIGHYNGYPLFASIKRETQALEESTLSGKVCAGHLIIPQLGGTSHNSKITLRQMKMSDVGDNYYITERGEKIMEFSLPADNTRGKRLVDPKGIKPKNLNGIDCSIFVPNALGPTSDVNYQASDFNKHVGGLDGRINHFVLRFESKKPKNVWRIWKFSGDEYTKEDSDEWRENKRPGLIVRHIPFELQQKFARLKNTGPISQTGVENIERMAPTTYMPIRWDQLLGDLIWGNTAEFAWE